MKSSNLGPLQNGDHVVVIGGGPGGVATAIALKHGAASQGQDVRVTVVEGKQLSNRQHFNQCTGVLSPPIIQLIERDLQIPFPYHLCQKTISGYVLHTTRRSVILDGNSEPSISLRRIEFDAYMTEAARQCHVDILSARVTDVEFHSDGVLVYTESNPLEASVVVGAFGLDRGTAKLFEHSAGYRPPPALGSIITKYHPGEVGMQQFGDHIHAFLPASPRIEFGAVTPKSNHLTINIAGTDVDADLMREFLAMPEVQQILPSLENAQRSNNLDLRFFKGHFPCGLAKNFSGDRYVMVGDASGLVRAFKGKGVTSAILTGLRAADVILHKGISAAAFQSYHDANRDISGDLIYGNLMRRLTILSSRMALMDATIQASKHNPVLRQALFDAVSAHCPYKDVLQAAFSPSSVVSILKEFVNRSNGSS